MSCIKHEGHVTAAGLSPMLTQSGIRLKEIMSECKINEIKESLSTRGLVCPLVAANAVAEICFV